MKLIAGTKFQIKLTISIFGVPVGNKKTEYQHRILHIPTSLGAKLHLKLTIFSFFIQICPRRVFPL